MLSVTQNQPEYRDSRLLKRWFWSCSQLISNVYLRLQSKYGLNSTIVKHQTSRDQSNWHGHDLTDESLHVTVLGAVFITSCLGLSDEISWWIKLVTRDFAEGVGFSCEKSTWPHLRSTLRNRSCSCELVRRYFPPPHYCEATQECAELL